MSEQYQDKVYIDNLELASNKQRIRAFVIDDLAITFIVMLIMWDQISATNGDMFIVINLLNEAFFQVMALKFLYQTLFVWYYGATLGKFIAKIRVIDYDHFGRVSFVNSALRAMGRLLSEMFFYFGFFLAFYTKSRQTLHDKIGKTLVVNV